MPRTWRIFFHGRLVADLATQRVAGVGGIGDQAAGANNIHRPLDQALLGVRRMNFEILRHASERRPDRLEALRQWRQFPRQKWALAGPVEIRAARGQETKFTRQRRVLAIVMRLVAASDNFQTTPARRLELSQNRRISAPSSR
jgi:hypothetical protein